MIAFILATENIPFAIALGLMVGIGLLEGVTTLLGFGASSFIDSFLPDMDVDVDADMDIDADVGDIGAPNALSNLLSWFNIGRVPVLVLMVLFLFGFGMTGLIIQSAAHDITGQLLPGLLSSALAFGVAIFFVKFSGMAVAKIIPKDETEAVSETSFIGRIAVITLGTAKQGHPAQAKLRDQYGQTHYVMVEPDTEKSIFETGSEVLLVRQAGAVFYAIPNTSSVLAESSE
ncbi:YqiJ family protein [Desulfonema magnum]|uniref:DUF1449 n=1 Tax=Desulfonema magnum TaxID=45655 RepID=A0A975GRD5_9BACT|nr:YqiJ family protein [Desulfonema magnum]QTA90780.1 DUF1449 [Desulfonema magnum]